jgi:hypothetical protein
MSRTVEIYGPLEASYEIKWSDSGGVSMYNTLARVRGEIAYFRRDGRMAIPTVTRTECCPGHGCNGDGTRNVRDAHGHYRTIPCKGCRGRTDFPEDATALEPMPVECDWESLASVLAKLGYTHEISTNGFKVILKNGMPMHRATANGTWKWLEETGQIILMENGKPYKRSV